MLLRSLRRLFNRSGEKQALVDGGSITLPDDVVALMAERRAYKVTDFVDWASNQPEHARLFAALLDRVRSEAWPDKEVAKLQAYDVYFSKNYLPAYEAAAPYLEDADFDPDYFGIAAMSLFNTNQFDRAYKLLRKIQKHEHLLIDNLGYQVAAALICWSAGDRYLTNRYIDIGTRGTIDAGLMAFNAIAMYFELGDMEGYQRVFSGLPDGDAQTPSFRYSSGFLELAKNNYLEGFEQVEHRYELPEAFRYMRLELLAQPRWQREDISGKRLLIHGEQGLGDMIQTARFFGACLRDAAHVIVECPPESMALLQHNFPQIEFVALNSEEAKSLDFDVWVGTLSLPYIYQVEHDTVPGRSGYLSLPPDHVDYWKQSVNDRGRPGAPKIGIAWSGFPGHRADHRRSLDWELIKPLLASFPEVDFYAVQINVPKNLPFNLYDCTEEMATLSDTAALVNEMDLIISVDTSVVHIAGAIGKETWMLLPYRYEWRWGLVGEDNPWYDSIRVIRQPSPGAWAPVLSLVFGRRLRAFLNKKKDGNENS